MALSKSSWLAAARTATTKDWNKEKVQQYLADLGLNELMPAFHEHEVTGDVLLWCVDVGRHMAILYAAQVASEAAWDREHGGGVTSNATAAAACPFTQEDEVALAELTAVGRAFHVTLRQIMNASFTCSVLFGATTLLESFRGSIGSAFPNLRRRTIVNTR